MYMKCRGSLTKCLQCKQWLIQYKVKYSRKRNVFNFHDAKHFFAHFVYIKLYNRELVMSIINPGK